MSDTAPDTTRPGFVEAYSKTTGQKRIVPAHYLMHPVLGRNLTETPSSQARTPGPVPTAPPTSPAAAGDGTTTAASSTIKEK